MAPVRKVPPALYRGGAGTPSKPSIWSQAYLTVGYQGARRKRRKHYKSQVGWNICYPVWRVYNGDIRPQWTRTSTPSFEEAVALLNYKLAVYEINQEKFEKKYGV